MTLLVHGALLALHAFLLAWAIVGLCEFVAPSVPWPWVTNPMFPPWVLLLHWTSVLFAGAAFLIGYARRLRATPVVMTVAYMAMAAVCALETFFFLRHAGRFRDMALEYAAYLALVALLFSLPSLRARFDRN